MTAKKSEDIAGLIVGLKELTLHEKLVLIQQDLHAPKDQRNDFAGFNYRSAESILEAAKPLAHALGCTVMLSDEIVHIGDRYYVKAIATLSDGKGCISTTGFAREPEEKKKTDSMQLTGSASSYARKYALNGLLAIDDGKDADADEYRANSRETPEDAPQATNTQSARVSPAESEEQGYPEGVVYETSKKAIRDMCVRHKVEPGAGTIWIQGQYGGRTLEDMKGDDDLILKVTHRMTTEFIPAYLEERKQFNETNNAEG